MKRVVVKVTNNSDLEVAKDSILDQISYLIFVEQFRSFNVLTFDIPEENEETALSDIRSLGHRATWDIEVSCDPVAELNNFAAVEHPEEEVTGNASYGTRNITTTGSGTIYVRVANISGQNLYVFSSSINGTYSTAYTQSGFLQGGTYTFDTSHSSNAGHPFRFSETPDGTWKSGSEYNATVTVNGTPGSAGSYTRILFDASTPSVLFYYCSVHSGMGRAFLSPDIYGTVNLHDFWHLDRITKSDRSYLNRQFSSTETGDGVDIYVIDSGVRGASRPTGTNASLHPELYDPDFTTDLNGLSEQQNYRVYQLPHYAGAYGSNNEDDNGHGTNCAVLAAGRTAGVSRKSRIYALKAFNSSLSSAYSQILGAYQAVIDHNDPTSGNYKGDNRPAIINSSFGPTIPSGGYPYIELNDPGVDVGTEVEILDEIEKTVTDTYNIIIARSAGNGFRDAGDNFAGPIQGKYIAGTRTAGYSDPIFNSVDPDQNKISVGATEYNDRWSYFSNYGGGVTTTAPGSRVLCPKYDWTSNTSYTSTINYNLIDGTSFSCPIVVGILASWVSANGYDRTTPNLPQASKNFCRGDGSDFLANGAGTSTYPVNSLIEKALPTNPFSVSNGSSDLVITFNSTDSSYFIGNVGEKVQLRAVSGTTVGGVNIHEQGWEWLTISAENAGSNTITVTMASSGTSTESLAGGSGHYLAVLKDTHELTDGPEFSNTQLYTQTDAQEGVSATAIQNIPVDPGVDFNLSSLGTTNRGIVYPYVDSIVTWANSPGSVGGSPFADGSSVNYSLGLSSLTTWSSEPITIQGYTLSGDSLSGTGLSFDTNTGVLSGTTTSIYLDVVKNITVTETTSGQSQAYTFTLTGTGVGINITQQPSTTQVEAGGGINATFTVAGTADDASTVTFQWEYSTDGGSNWATISSLAGHSGETTDTLTVDDDYAFDDYQYRCVLDSATAVNPSTSNAATLLVYRVVTIGTQPTNQTPVAPATATFFVTASTADGATVTYQWEKSEDNVTYTPIGGATSASYTTGATSYDADYGDYYRCICSADGVSVDATSNPAQILLTRTITITTQPADVTGAVGGTVQFSVVANTSDNDAGDITYQWQFSIDSGSNWSNVVGGSGDTTATYTTPILDSTYDEHRYRCLLSAAAAPTINSGTAVLQVETVTVVVTQQPTNQTTDENTTATFTCAGDISMGQIGANAASSSFDIDQFDTPQGGGGNEIVLQSQHEPSVTYQWQKSDDGGSNWGDISGATNPSYTTASLTYSSDNGDLYRCKLDAVGAATPAYTNNVTLTVLRVYSITAQPANQTANENGTASFSISVTATSGAPSYQWQRSDDNGANYTNISGATNATYTTPPLIYAQDNDDRYRCLVDLVGSSGQLTSSFALLTVLRVITISAQPQSIAVIEGSTATFSVTASITSDVISYQWQISTNTGSSWSNINGANSSSYTTPATVYPTSPDVQYRCLLTNVAATTVTTSVATLTVNESEFVSTPSNIAINTDPDTLRTFNRRPTFTSSAFVPEYTGSTHFSSFWRIRRVSDNATVYDTAGTYVNGDTGNLTTFTVPQGVLSFDTNYVVQVKYRDNAGLESSYSSSFSFTTPFVDQPVIQTIVPAFNPTVNTDTAEVKAGYVHTSSDWQFSATNSFLTIIHQSLGNTSNLNSYILPQDVSLDPNTTYYVRIRFNVNPQ